MYPLPPSLGTFPVHKVDDYLDKVPESWKKTGGVFIPMYQREAMWMQFNLKNRQAPKAIKVAVGKVNAITGEQWSNNLTKVGNKQDYVVAPQQSWLDGINAGDGRIKQFVAMPLGSGYSVEAQVTGKEEFGGLQIMVFDSDKEQRNRQFPKPTEYAWPVNKTPTTVTKPYTSSTLTLDKSQVETMYPLKFSHSKPITVHYKKGSNAIDGAWLGVFRTDQPSTDYGVHTTRWTYLTQQQGSFTIYPQTLTNSWNPYNAQYHFRLFDSSSTYTASATSETFSIGAPPIQYPYPNPYPTVPPHFSAVPASYGIQAPTTLDNYSAVQESFTLDSLSDFISNAPQTMQTVPFSSVQAQPPMQRAQPSAMRCVQSLKKKAEQPRSKSIVTNDAKEMSLSAGGSMKQKIVEDPYGVNFWDISTGGRVFVHIVNSSMYKQITGRDAPETPITAQTYTNLGYKWFDIYDENVKGVASSSILNNVQSVKQIDQQKYAWPQQNDSSVNIQGSQVITSKAPYNPNQVRDGDW